MILILSHNHIEEPTNNVIDWLRFKEAKFKRINGDDFILSKNFTLDLEKKTLENNVYETIYPDDVSIVWYRRWIKPLVRSVNFNGYIKNNFSVPEILLIESYETFLKNELTAYSNGIFSLFDNKEWIPNVQSTRGKLNKIDVLFKAKKLGLQIPNTIITTSKEVLINFYKKNETLITKPIFEVLPMIYKKTSISMYTRLVELSDINNFPDQFSPSLFQKKIDKLFEIRVFIYKKKLFSMAIFSQNDDQTKVDFRNYNDQKPNRNVPFKLPKDISNKIFKLMANLKLNTGSIDLMVSKENDYIFLEINPVGQLGMVSLGGNYYLEKMIADDLIRIDNKYVRNKKN